ncbi:MAG: hypothetical protein LUG44_09360 [Clostridiales bacterium]|nr:hypothetical protein [Clostridiales bacterium]
MEQCEGAAAYFYTLFTETISENLAEALASALMYLDDINGKDDRVSDAYGALEEADAITNTLMEREE